MIPASIILTAYTRGGAWADEALSLPVVRRALAGGYGFTPNEVFVNAQAKGKSASRYWLQLEQRLAAGSVELLRATLGGKDSVPRFSASLTDDRDAPCIISLELPYSRDEVTPAFVTDVAQIAAALADDTRAEFLRGHDLAGWRELHRERRGHRLFVPSYVDRAYWLTYLCDDYVARLGGEEKLRRAPAFACTKLPRGILLQSHADFLDLSIQPGRGELDALQACLAGLVRPEERP